MNSLPSSIENALQEAGFSSTEILILKRLLEEDALTLRQIASKTGKSTGVLDQAMKKLLQKDIVSKEWFNGTFKFTIVSLESIVRWMEQDVRSKRESLLRRHQNFESFIATLQLDKKRPEMQYYNGREGLEQAYLRLLGHGTEMLWYVPVLWTADEDPMRDFRVQYFRERRRRGIFSRVIAHDTPLGRRYQSRDAFEYRQTILVPEDQYPFTFEKAIVGDTITCFNLEENGACYIHYPEMASMERAIFEGTWNRDKHVLPVASSAPSQVQTEPVVPLKTKTLSRLREFFVSKESLVTLGIFAIVAAGVTYGLYHFTQVLNFERLRQQVTSIAATAAYQFNASDIDALREEKDWQKPEWAKVVGQLRTLRESNSDLLFAYIVRKSSVSPSGMEFVADSHSLNPYANTDSDPKNDVDANTDGKIDAVNEDQLQWPGQPYLTPPAEVEQGFTGPIANEHFYQDKWGRMISGYAPIKDAQGKPVAVLAVDIRDTRLNELTAQSFAPILWFFGLLLLFLLIRLAAFNRSLLKEVWDVFEVRRALTILALCAEISFFVTFGLYQYTLNLTKKEIGTRLMSIVSTASSDFDTKDLDQLHFARDMKTEVYQKVFTKLNEIRENNKEIKFVYIYRPIDPPSQWEFVADADSSYNLPFYKDFNKDGVLNKADENVAPGIRYYTNCASLTTKKPSFSDFCPSQWGTVVSASAPIGNKESAILGVDVDVSQVYSAVNKKFVPWLWFFGVFSLILIFIEILKIALKRNTKK